MLKVYRTKFFEKSIKRLTHSGKCKPQAREDLSEVVRLLELGEKLPHMFTDHQLKGEFKELRECHIKGDLLLVYQIKEKELVLLLVDIGSHSYLDL